MAKPNGRLVTDATPWSTNGVIRVDVYDGRSLRKLSNITLLHDRLLLACMVTYYVLNETVTTSMLNIVYSIWSDMCGCMASGL